MNFFKSKNNIIYLAMLAILIILPFLGIPRTTANFFYLFFIYLTMANMWNLLAGYSGLVSLAQPAFIGIAGYVLVVLTWNGMPFYLGFIAAPIICGLFAMVISVPVFRMSGLYFAIGTLVIPEVLRLTFFLWQIVPGELVGRGSGYVIRGTDGLTSNHVYLFALTVGVASILLMNYILKSKLGMGLLGIRDSARAAASCGVNVYKVKLSSFIISAAVTGIAGVVFYLNQGYIEPNSAFGLRWTMIIMLSVAIGGMGTERGPIIGAAVITLLHFILGRYPGVSMVIQGVILLGIMLLAPQGLLPLVTESRLYRALTGKGTRQGIC